MKSFHVCVVWHYTSHSYLLLSRPQCCLFISLFIPYDNTMEKIKEKRKAVETKGKILEVSNAKYIFSAVC